MGVIVAGTGAVSRVRGRRGGGESPVGSRRRTGETPMGASAPDPKERGIAGTPGNGPEVAGLRSAAMIMAYINGDWQYVCRALGSGVSVCEHSHDTNSLYLVLCKESKSLSEGKWQQKYTRPHEAIQRSINAGRLRKLGPCTFSAQNYLQISPAPDGNPADAPSMFCARGTCPRCTCARR